MLKQLQLPFRALSTGGILSRKHGGIAGVGKYYCRYWEQRPPRLLDRVMCTGEDGLWLPCPDYRRCRLNKPEGRQDRDPKKPPPNYSLRGKPRTGDSDGQDHRNQPDDPD